MKKQEVKKVEEKEEVKPNRFTYSDDQGLKVLTEKDILASLDKKDDDKTENKQIKKGFTQWL